jgi:uncharacterized alpha-E superfamily protein
VLSRTAANLYWLARYIERAENLARLVDVGQRMTSLAPASAGSMSEWHSTVIASGCQESFYKKHQQADAASVIHHLVLDPDNPSSIWCCLATARQNARAVRTALTVDMWEAVNSTWLELQNMRDDFSLERLPRMLDWIKERSLLFNGAVTSTMLRKDAYWFTRLGTFVERGDNTARILDVKYHVLLPQYESVGGTLDYYQWASILRSVSALRAYHWVYNDRLKPWLVAELLILRPEMPRSLVTCFNEINLHLNYLASVYGTKGECHRLAGKMQSQLVYGKIEDVFQSGLHQFLTDVIDTTLVLGDEITKQYLV